MNTQFPIKQFRLEHGYSFDHPLKCPEFAKDNILIGGTPEDSSLEALFLGKLGEYDNMRANVWLDLTGAHAIYIMGKRRSGKTFTLGAIAEGLASSQWIKQGTQKQAVLLLDTMNVFLTMPNTVEEVFGKNSRECKELKQWGLESEHLPVKLFYPKGSPRPPEGLSEELTLRACDLTGEDWAALFGVDTFSDPIGQLLAELYDWVFIEGYQTSKGEIVQANSNYHISDLLLCLTNNPEIQRYEFKTIEAVRRYLKAVDRLPIFSETGINIQKLFKEGQISTVLLGDLDHNLRGLMVGIIVKKIMEYRSISDRFERLADLYMSKSLALKVENPEEAKKILKKYEEYAEQAKSGLPRGWIIIDEAHNYLPAKGIITSRAPLKKYVNEGRNLGLSIVVATQQPSGLDPAIQRNADILIIHSMSMTDDIQTAEHMVNTSVPESIIYDNHDRITSRVFEKMIRSLDLGFAIVSNDRIDRVFPIKIRPRITIHGGRKY
jgi:hypothetical protein